MGNWDLICVWVFFVVFLGNGWIFVIIVVVCVCGSVLFCLLIVIGLLLGIILGLLVCVLNSGVNVMVRYKLIVDSWWLYIILSNIFCFLFLLYFE